MKRVGYLVAEDHTMILDIFKENNIEIVLVGMNLVELKYFNLKEFTRYKDLIPDNKEYYTYQEEDWIPLLYNSYPAGRWFESTSRYQQKN